MFSKIAFPIQKEDSGERAVSLKIGNKTTVARNAITEGTPSRAALHHIGCPAQDSAVLQERTDICHTV